MKELLNREWSDELKFNLHYAVKISEYGRNNSKTYDITVTCEELDTIFLEIFGELEEISELTDVENGVDYVMKTQSFGSVSSMVVHLYDVRNGMTVTRPDLETMCDKFKELRKCINAVFSYASKRKNISTSMDEASEFHDGGFKMNSTMVVPIDLKVFGEFQQKPYYLRYMFKVWAKFGSEEDVPVFRCEGDIDRDHSGGWSVLELARDTTFHWVFSDFGKQVLDVNDTASRTEVLSKIPDLNVFFKKLRKFLKSERSGTRASYDESLIRQIDKIL